MERHALDPNRARGPCTIPVSTRKPGLGLYRASQLDNTGIAVANTRDNSNPVNAFFSSYQPWAALSSRVDGISVTADDVLSRGSGDGLSILLLCSALWRFPLFLWRPLKRACLLSFKAQLPKRLNLI